MDPAQQTHSPLSPISRRGALTLAATGALLATPPAAAAAGSGGHRGKHGRLPAVVTLPDGIRPEGITSGPGTRFYVGSLADGRIVSGDLRAGSTAFTLLPGAAGRQLRGLFWDERTDLVWAAGNVGAEAHVWAVDARVGAVVSDTVVPGAVFLNDLVVTRRTVWVTDSRVDRLTAIPLDRRGRPTGGAPTFLALGGDWPSGPGTAINANGVRALDDRTLVLNNSRVGGLWRVNTRNGVTREIPVKGGPGIVGGDGLELVGSTLYNVRGSGPNQVAVVRLRESDDGWVARWRTALTAESLDVPSTATFAGGSLWAVNARFGTAGPEPARYWVTRLRVP